MVAWLTPFYQSMGWTLASSGSLVAAMAAAQAVAALAIPFLARRSVDRRGWLFCTLTMQGIGFAGLAFLPMTSPFVWVIVCGAGLAGSFALAIVTALDHLPTPQSAGTLAALMQGGGFLIAALAPYVMALMINWTGDYTFGWIMHLFFVAATFALYARFDPNRYAEAMDTAPRDHTT
jgi:CP family cyanate transporter-like MFS transporter